MRTFYHIVMLFRVKFIMLSILPNWHFSYYRTKKSILFLLCYTGLKKYISEKLEKKKMGMGCICKVSGKIISCSIFSTFWLMKLT